MTKKQKKISVWCSTVGVCLMLFHSTLFPSVALAEEGVDKISIVTETWLPYSFRDTEGQVKGVATDIVLRVIKQAGLDYSIGIYPWSRAYSKALHDKNTLIYALLYSEERAQKFQMVGQVAPTDRLYFYRLKGRKDVTLMEPEDARAYVVGASRDSIMEAYLLEKGFPRRRIVQATVNAFTMLERGRVDLVISSVENARSLLEAEGKPQDLYERLLLVEACRPFMALSANTPSDIVERIQNAYDTMLKEGAIPDFTTH